MANVVVQRKSGFIRRGGVTRCETAWLGGVLVSSTIASGNAAVLMTSLGVAALALRPFTVVRTRGLVTIKSDQQAASEDFFGAWGTAVVSDQAVAIGVTAIPTPIFDNDSDLWLAYEFLASDFVFGSAVGFAQTMTHRVVDSRAMRKVDVGQDLITVIERDSVGSGAVMSAFTRTLVKLH